MTEMINWAVDIHGNVAIRNLNLFNTNQPLTITEATVTRNVKTVKLLGIDIVPTRNWTYRYERV